MLFIFEGCDGTGKTTLAKRLAPILDADIIHCTTETPNDYPFFSEIVSASISRNIIADRFCYGQFVYQTERERKLSQTQLFQLEAEMLNAGVKLIYVTADTKDIMDRLISRGETTAKSVDDIKSGFVSILKKSILQPIVWRT